MKFQFTLALCLLGFALAAQSAVAGEPAGQPIQVGSFRVERDVTPGRNKVVGTLTNISHVQVHVAKLSFRLFDAKGREIGLAADEVHDLGPGQTWKFHARALGNVSRARLLSIEAR